MTDELNVVTEQPVEQIEPSAPPGSVEEAALRLNVEAQEAAADASVELPEPEHQPAVDETLEPQAQQQAARLQQAQQVLAQEQQDIALQQAEIKQLREIDPGEYAAQMLELTQREARFHQAVGEYQAAINGVQQQAVSESEKTLAQEHKRLEAKIPGWNKTKESQLKAYMRKQGYSERQITSIADHRQVVAFYKAMQKDQSPKRLPTRKSPQNNSDARMMAEQEITRRNLGKHTVAAAAERIAAMGVK